MPERPEQTKAFKRICKEAARGAAAFQMLHEGDRVLVAISGGEDSLLLMHVLTVLQKRAPFNFTLIPANVNLQFATFNAGSVQEYCQRQGWELRTATLDGQALIEEKEQGHQPCPLCSRLRRGQLHHLADELQCNVIALGHHLDDLCASLFISVCRGGGIKTMGPNVPGDGGSKRIIRPLVFCTKPQIHEAAEYFQFPKIQSCPYEDMLAEQGDRAMFGKLLAELEAKIPNLKQNILHSLSDVRVQHLLDQQFLKF